MNSHPPCKESKEAANKLTGIPHWGSFWKVGEAGEQGRRGHGDAGTQRAEELQDQGSRGERSEGVRG
ncbi:MAG: hypothetical protein BRC54_11400 [Cyanobacteria bacterium SW_7_48_12]|nr:MAG: hypothetical protein BRC54_11400 [Cyanobacteria bacterium SW_7_48_12]